MKDSEVTDNSLHETKRTNSENELQDVYSNSGLVDNMKAVSSTGESTTDVLLTENLHKERGELAETYHSRAAAESSKVSRISECLKMFRSARFQVYASHFLSSWGDRMWMFAGGLFLLEVTPGSLRLAAVYGAALASTVILLGAPIGRFVDRTSRLKAAQICLCIQNIMVCVCAAILVLITTRRHLFTAWNGWSLIVAEGGVILTACIAQIGTLGSKLTIEKDWILVICGQNRSKLAGMNSVLRSLDLGTEVLAPVIVGAVMSYFGMAAGGIVIACWNVGSLVIEYALLHHLYYSSEDLQKSKVHTVETLENTDDTDDLRVDIIKKTKLNSLKDRLQSAWGAWIVYMKHPVRDAGLGLALLYMTVLAFDNYSRAFVFESGVSETVLGVLTATASLFGILGAISYPKLREKFGVAKAGLIGFGSETMCLTLCFASVFAPGSPFDASALVSRSIPSNHSSPLLYTTLSPTITNISAPLEEQNITSQYTAESKNSSEDDSKNDYTYVILLLTGIITSRTGLWLADLSVTQILQENVNENERGAVNGVQSSLNQSLDLLRSILLIILPTRDTFGFLIILSFIFVLTGWMLFGVYAHQHKPRSDASAEDDSKCE